jgi:hypothetical protein
MPLRKGINAAFNFTHPAPQNISRISILLIAGDNTTLATDALLHVEMETVLLAGLGFAGWNELNWLLVGTRKRGLFVVQQQAAFKKRKIRWMIG